MHDAATHSGCTRCPPVRVFAAAMRLLSMNSAPSPLHPLSFFSSSTCFYRPASSSYLDFFLLSPTPSPLSLIASIFVHLRNHQELGTWRKASEPEWKRRVKDSQTNKGGRGILFPPCEENLPKGWQRWVRQDLT